MANGPASATHVAREPLQSPVPILDDERVSDGSTVPVDVVFVAIEPLPGFDVVLVRVKPNPSYIEGYGTLGPNELKVGSVGHESPSLHGGRFIPGPGCCRTSALLLYLRVVLIATFDPPKRGGFVLLNLLAGAI
jgi:hypothetical protein